MKSQNLIFVVFSFFLFGACSYAIILGLLLNFSLKEDHKLLCENIKMTGSLVKILEDDRIIQEKIAERLRDDDKRLSRLEEFFSVLCGIKKNKK